MWITSLPKTFSVRIQVQCVIIHVYLSKKYKSFFLHRIFFQSFDISVNHINGLSLLLNWDIACDLDLYEWQTFKLYPHAPCLKTFNFIQHPIFLKREWWSFSYYIFWIALYSYYPPKCFRLWVFSIKMICKKWWLFIRIALTEIILCF